MRRVLFVCTGNTCRSPMAEAIFNRIVRERGLKGIRASSAGTSAVPGMSATMQAVTVAQKHGLDIRRHRSRPLTPEIVDEADLILTMTGCHWYDATELADREKVSKLTSVGGGGDDGDDILDPFGGSLEVYEEVYRELESEITRAFPDIIELASHTADGD